MRLLVVEDDRDLNRQITSPLEAAGYAVDRAFDGEEGWFQGDTDPYDAVVLDIGLPKRDGISILEAWRKARRLMPVLILTARGGATRCRASTRALSTLSPNPFTWRRCWRGYAPCCAAPPVARPAIWRSTRSGSKSTASRRSSPATSTDAGRIISRIPQSPQRENSLRVL